MTGQLFLSGQLKLYPDLLAKADVEAQNQANDTTGLREIAARISSAIIRGAYQYQIEIDASERPRKVRYISSSEHEAHAQDDIEPLKRNEIIDRDSAQLSAHDVYRIAEFETISKQLKQFFGLDFEVDHAQALLNHDKPGSHHPDNLQLLLKAHNGKKT